MGNIWNKEQKLRKIVKYKGYTIHFYRSLEPWDDSGPGWRYAGSRGQIGAVIISPSGQKFKLANTIFNTGTIYSLVDEAKQIINKSSKPIQGRVPKVPNILKALKESILDNADDEWRDGLEVNLMAERILQNSGRIKRARSVPELKQICQRIKAMCFFNTAKEIIMEDIQHIQYIKNRVPGELGYW